MKLSLDDIGRLAAAWRGFGSAKFFELYDRNVKGTNQAARDRAWLWFAEYPLDFLSHFRGGKAQRLNKAILDELLHLAKTAVPVDAAEVRR